MHLAQNLAAIPRLESGCVSDPNSYKDQCRPRVSEPLQGEGGHAGLREGLS